MLYSVESSDDSDNELLQSDDFGGNADEKAKASRFAKGSLQDSQIYGIFAEDDSEDEQEGGFNDSYKLFSSKRRKSFDKERDVVRFVTAKCNLDANIGEEKLRHEKNLKDESFFKSVIKNVAETDSAIKEEDIKQNLPFLNVNCGGSQLEQNLVKKEDFTGTYKGIMKNLHLKREDEGAYLDTKLSPSFSKDPGGGAVSNKQSLKKKVYFEDKAEVETSLKSKFFGFSTFQGGQDLTITSKQSKTKWETTSDANPRVLQTNASSFFHNRRSDNRVRSEFIDETKDSSLVPGGEDARKSQYATTEANTTVTPTTLIASSDESSDESNSEDEKSPAHSKDKSQSEEKFADSNIKYTKYSFSDANLHTGSSKASQDGTDPNKKMSRQKNTWNMKQMSKAYGAGFKMLQKMGYSGGGLGADGAGIANPIEVRIRNKNMGLQNSGERIRANDRMARGGDSIGQSFRSRGSGGYEEDLEGEDDISVLKRLLAPKKTVERGQIERKKENWRASTHVQTKHTLPRVNGDADNDIERGKLSLSSFSDGLLVPKTAAQIAIEGRLEASLPGPSSTPKGIRIIDMTGPETRVLDSATDIKSSLNFDDMDTALDGAPSNDINNKELFPLQGLLLSLKARSYELENMLKGVAREKKFEEDALISLSHDHDIVSTEIDTLDRKVGRAEQVLKGLESIEAMVVASMVSTTQKNSPNRRTGIVAPSEYEDVGRSTISSVEAHERASALPPTATANELKAMAPHQLLTQALISAKSTFESNERLKPDQPSTAFQRDARSDSLYERGSESVGKREKHVVSRSYQGERQVANGWSEETKCTTTPFMVPESCNDSTSSSQPVGLMELYDLVKGLAESFPEEFEALEVHEMIFSLFIPLLILHFRDWVPLLQPYYGTELISKWTKFFADLLLEKSLKDSDGAGQLYASKTVPHQQNAESSQDSFYNERHTMDSFMFPAELPVHNNLTANSGKTRDLSAKNPKNFFHLQYENLLNKEILQRIKTSLVMEWDPKDCEPAVQLCEAWQDRLNPQQFCNLLYEGVIMPKLLMTVGSWDPHTDPLPIHTWIHPWLPLLETPNHPHLMAPLWDPISFKLCSCLVHWHPADRSVLPMIAPWKHVLSWQWGWEDIMHRYILPKLQEHITMIFMHPHHQLPLRTTPLEDLFWWKDTLSDEDIIRLLDSSFFPNFVKFLENWVAHHSVTEKQEVVKWYKMWKSVFPASLLSNSTVKAWFMQILSILSSMKIAGEGVWEKEGGTGDSSEDARAGWDPSVSSSQNADRFTPARQDVPLRNVSGQAYWLAPEKTTPMVSDASKIFHGRAFHSRLKPPDVSVFLDKSAASSRDDAYSPLQGASPPPPPEEPPPPTPEEMRSKLTLKDYLEQIAGNHDFVMKPKIGRIENGKQVYSFGGASIFIDNNIIFVMEQGVWNIISVENLIALAKKRKGSK